VSQELEEVLERILEEHGNVRRIEFHAKVLLAYLRDEWGHDAAIVQHLIGLAYELGRRLGKKAGGAGGLVEELALAAYAWFAIRRKT